MRTGRRDRTPSASSNSRSNSRFEVSRYSPRNATANVRLSSRTGSGTGSDEPGLAPGTRPIFGRTAADTRSLSAVAVKTISVPTGTCETSDRSPVRGTSRSAIR
jgi:hypothetical protein